MSEGYRTTELEEIKPPVTSVGVIGWIRGNLFNGVFNSILTVVILYLLWKIIPPFIRWAFLDSMWVSAGAECRGTDGACWSVVTGNIRFIMFGFFPYESQWRPLLAMILLVGLLYYSQNRAHWKKSLAYAWVIGLFTMGLLMKGGLFGLRPVESTEWGGLPLTLLLSVFGLTAAYPLGVCPRGDWRTCSQGRARAPGRRPIRRPDRPPQHVSQGNRHGAFQQEDRALEGREGHRGRPQGRTRIRTEAASQVRRRAVGYRPCRAAQASHVRRAQAPLAGDRVSHRASPERKRYVRLHADRLP